MDTEILVYRAGYIIMKRPDLQWNIIDEGAEKLVAVVNTLDDARQRISSWVVAR